MSGHTETIIKPSGRGFQLNGKELMEYRDLLLLLIRRDFVARYKQTVLGPAWAVIQPVLTSLVFTLIFGKVAKIPTDGAPPFLFYLTGMLFWQMFSASLLTGGNSLQTNSALFSKVYFPRIIPSLATQISQLIPFTIQFVIFSGFYIWYQLSSDTAVFHWARLMWVPLLICLVMLTSLSLSMLYSALTAKYRDLQHALGFIVQLGLYATPVIYPVSSISAEWRSLMWANPLAAPISCTKWIFLDTGTPPGWPLLISFAISIALFFVATVLFQRVQRTFIDTV